jgi:hypothetical protein
MYLALFRLTLNLLLNVLGLASLVAAMRPGLCRSLHRSASNSNTFGLAWGLDLALGKEQLWSRGPDSFSAGRRGVWGGTPLPV